MTKELHEQSVAMEATPEECVQKTLETWKHMCACLPNHGLDELMGIVKCVYRDQLDISQGIVLPSKDDIAKFVNAAIKDIAKLTKIKETAEVWKTLNKDHHDSKVSPQYAAGCILDRKLPGKCIKEYENEDTVK